MVSSLTHILLTPSFTCPTPPRPSILSSSLSLSLSSHIFSILYRKDKFLAFYIIKYAKRPESMTKVARFLLLPHRCYITRCPDHYHPPHTLPVTTPFRFSLHSSHPPDTDTDTHALTRLETDIRPKVQMTRHIYIYFITNFILILTYIFCQCHYTILLLFTIKFKG